ncbi:siderophore ABC transporter substrate-binding protein [Photobacterium gaetbulicola]|uniref:siderophore ABC transporter substrate-binding protein n=1 Tax=Photobacterium gaetbulicola TaxID=1295392 RepID=UPI000AD3D11B|nr:ABC transporter substrate-binding protein [Photobacterium gaetbulicola]
MTRFSTVLKSALLVGAMAINFPALAESITVKHSLGTTTIEQTPQRVVVVGGHGSLDTLNRLGIEPVGAVTTMLPEYLSDYSEKATHIGSMKEANFEQIFTLQPDVIIAESRMVDAYPTLSQIAPTVMHVVENGSYWEDTKNNWRMLGKIFDKKTEAEQLIEETAAQMAEVREQVQKKGLKTLAVMNNGNNVSMFGEVSRFSVLFDEFGFEPARASDTQNPHGNLISFEFIADAAPDVLFVLDRESAIGQSSGKAQQLFDNPLVKSTPAYKNNRIVFLNPSAWYLTIAGVNATEIMIDDARKAVMSTQ